MGQLQQYIAPPVTGGGTNSTLYAYDADRNLTDVLRPDGGTVHLGYDAAGRASAITLPTGETIALGYDAATGKLVSATGPTPGQALAYGYDGFLLTDTTWSGQVNGTVHRTYDNFFRLSTETVNGASPVTYGYDADGLVTSVGAMTLVPSPVNGLLTGTTLGGVTDAYTYDAYGQIASYTARFGSTVLYAYSIDERDALGRIKQKTETVQGVTHVYQYGSSTRGWLTDVATDGQVTGHYEYDANGNRTVVQQNGVTQTAYFDEQDRMLAQGALTFTYTANGEVRTKTDTATGEVTTYAYDALGNLVRVELPDGRVLEYVNDAMGRRVGKKVNGVLVKGWVYRDGLRIVAETDGSGNVVERFVYADGVATRAPRAVRSGPPFSLDEAPPITTPAYIVRNGVTYRVLEDQLGSALLAVDAAHGPFPLEGLMYDPWGTISTDSASGTLPMGFVGGQYDPDSGLVRFGARDYDPRLGRWTSRDPSGFNSAEANLYLYVENQPINSIDPAGRSKFDKLWGLPKAFWKWYHKVIKMPGDPDLTKEEAKALCDEWENLGKPKPDNKGPKGGNGGFGPEDIFDFIFPFPMVPDCLLKGTCGGDDPGGA